MMYSKYLSMVFSVLSSGQTVLYFHYCLRYMIVLTVQESMKMMGLPNYLHWTAWFVKSAMFLLVTTSLITTLLCTKW